MTKRGLPIEERFWMKVDKDGPMPDPALGAEGKCWKWLAAHGTGTGYSRFFGYDNETLGHRVSYRINVGPIPEGMFIDHICHNRSCTNPGHLRPVTNKQNMENLSSLQTNNKSGYQGVHWDTNRQKWAAKLRHNYRTINIGRFDTIEEAAEAARLKRLELFTHNDLDKAA